MGWAIFALLAAIVATGLVLARMPRMVWELVGSALLLGAAGYAWQGSPSLSGDPRTAGQTAPRYDEDLANLRNAFSGTDNKASPWLTMSDGLARQGDYTNATNALVAGLKANPDNANLWVALGNMLIYKADGALSPAARFSYAEAQRLAPGKPAPPYFYGLALAQAGDLESARTVWGGLQARVPPQSPLHAMLAADLARLDALLAGQSKP